MKYQKQFGYQRPSSGQPTEHRCQLLWYRLCGMNNVLPIVGRQINETKVRVIDDTILKKLKMSNVIHGGSYSRTGSWLPMEYSRRCYMICDMIASQLRGH